MEKEIAPMLKEIADQMGVAVPYLWDALISQASVYGVFTLLVSTMPFFLSGVAIWVFYRFYKENNDALSFLILIGAGTFVLFAFCGMWLVYDGVTALYNPEYWALKKILELVN